MSFGDAVSTCFKKYATFSGRARRSEYWWWTLFNFLVSVVVNVLNRSAHTQLFTLISLAVLVPSIAVGVRRLHDIGRTGWWYLIGLIPLVGTIVLIVWFCKDSEPGQNQYGPSPKSVDSAAATAPLA